MSSDNESASGGKRRRRKRGKKPQLNSTEMNEVFINKKNDIIIEENGEIKIASKLLPVWGEIAEMVNAKIMKKTGRKREDLKLKTSGGMYAHVCGDRMGIKDILCPSINHVDHGGAVPSEDVSINLLHNSTLEISNASKEPGFMITIHVPTADFDTLIGEHERIINAKKNAIYRKKYIKEGECQIYINQMIKNDTRSICDYAFDTFSLDSEGDNYGHLRGWCKCKSQINCYIRKKGSIMEIECQMTNGKSGLRCGMRSTRATGAPSQKGGSGGREESDRQDDDDSQIRDQESAHKYSLLHEDPIYALQLLKTFKMRADISIIQPDPIMICYCSPHQKTLYRQLNQNGDLRLMINSTESIIQPIQGPVNESESISYLHVVAGTDSGQVGLTQMLSESKQTHRVVSWLSHWMHDNGLTIPREIVTDGKSYITAACIRVFAGFLEMHEYANAFFETTVKPRCLVRIDAVFILRKYITIFAAVDNEEARKQYKAGIGELILSHTRSDAEGIIRALLTVATSYHDGEGEDGSTSASTSQQEILGQLSFEYILQQLQISEDELLTGSHKTCDQDRFLIDEVDENEWFRWGGRLSTSVADDIAQYPGDTSRMSPYWLGNLPEILLEDLKLLPLWSSVTSPAILSMQEPALLNPAREEVREIVKLFASTDLPIRADIFVEEHKRYIDGNKEKVNPLYNDEENYNYVSSDEELVENENSSANDRGDFDYSSDHQFQESSPRNVRDHVSVSSEDLNDFTDEIPDREMKKSNDNESSYLHEKDCNENVEEDINKNIGSINSPKGDKVDKNAQNAEDYAPQSINKPNITLSSAITCCSCNNAIISRRITLCSNCQRPVHTLEKCTVIIEGKKEDVRGNYICFKCSEQSNIAALIDSQARENWKNKTVEHEARTKQLEKRLNTVTPAVNAGNITKLRTFRLGDKNIEIIWSCPFDSLFQLVLSAAIQSKPFLMNVVNLYAQHNLFLDLIKDTEETRKITNRTLQKRYDILLKHFPLEEPQKSNAYKYTLRCDGSIRNVCEKLFEGVACFEEQLECDMACDMRQENSCLYSLSLKTFMSEDCRLIEEEITARKTCGNESNDLNCGGTTSSTIRLKSDFLWFKLWSALERTDRVALEKIPTSIKMSFMGEEFQLIGLIEFKPPILMKRKKRSKTDDNEDLSLGHYVTYCLHKETWHRYDIKHDTLKSENILIHPNFVMYAKVPKES